MTVKRKCQKYNLQYNVQVCNDFQNNRPDSIETGKKCMT